MTSYEDSFEFAVNVGDWEGAADVVSYHLPCLDPAEHNQRLALIAEWLPSQNVHWTDSARGLAMQWENYERADNA